MVSTSQKTNNNNNNGIDKNDNDNATSILKLKQSFGDVMFNRRLRLRRRFELFNLFLTNTNQCIVRTTEHYDSTLDEKKTLDELGLGLNSSEKVRAATASISNKGRQELFIPFRFQIRGEERRAKTLYPPHADNRGPVKGPYCGVMTSEFWNEQLKLVSNDITLLR